jgi:hypothetical protein
MENDAIVSGAAVTAQPATGRSLVLKDVLYDSFVKHAAEIRAIRSDSLLPLTTDAANAIRIAIGASRKWLALRARMLQLGDVVDQRLIDDNLSITYAFAYARTILLEEDPSEGVQHALYDEGIALRDKLALSQELLEKLDVKASHYLHALSRAPGNLNLSNYLIALVRFFRENWSAIDPLIPLVSVEDLQRAADIAHLLLDGAAERANGPISVAESSIVYQQSATLFQRSYNEVRHGVLCLRGREGDQELFAPSLFQRAPVRRKEEEGAAPVPDDDASVTPIAPRPLPEVPATPGNSVPVGHRGSNPFTS